MTGDVTIFERHRARLLSIAYRMLGEWAGAEDVVQEAWLRWRGVDGAVIRDAGAWLSTATMRLALDALRAAKARRETYVGPWLPEPILPDDERILLAGGPAEQAELASDLSLALMHVLERLSPDERAAFILHDAFDFDHREIAEALGKSEAASRKPQAASRKLVSRARERVKSDRPRFDASPEQRRDLIMRFAWASAGLDATELAKIFAPDAIAYTDGGRCVRAALNPIFGGEKIARFVISLARKYSSLPPPRWKLTEINGNPAMVVGFEGEPPSVISLESDGERVTALYVLRNPGKLYRIKGAFESWMSPAGLSITW
jgi:RNA polymerase sigma-70 factor, ECF subfamily